MNNVPKHLIIDLIPAYLANDISIETRNVIEKMTRLDPELAKIVDGSSSTNIYENFDANSHISAVDTLTKINAAVKRKMCLVALVTLGLLLIPLTVMNYTNQVNWALGDFIVMGVMLMVVGGTYVLISSLSPNGAFKAGIATTCLAVFLLIWISLAVGIIGDLSNIANLLYLLIFLSIGIGSWVSKLSPKGLSITMFVTSVLQLTIPLIAMSLFTLDMSMEGEIVGMFVINSVFVILFLVAGVFFKQAQRKC